MAAMACLPCISLPLPLSRPSSPSSSPSSPSSSPSSPSSSPSSPSSSPSSHASRARASPRSHIHNINASSFSLDSQSGGTFPGFPASCSNDKAIGKLESLFYTDSGIPEEKIERPTGLPKGLRAIGNNPRCPVCKAKGAVECATCAGSGLYVDAVLESQGIIVKVRCLGCGGAGNHMCLQCGGRGHV